MVPPIVNLSISSNAAAAVSRMNTKGNCFFCFNAGNCGAVANDVSNQSAWQVYTLKELRDATENFHERNKIGEGGFGTVYRGRTSGGEAIAVKRLKALTVKAEMEFAVEVEILGRVRHKNLLGLRGFYVGIDERLIVYDYMANQSLSAHLHGRHTAAISWLHRINIATGAAQGIAYLHNEVKPRIVHRDVKSSNVLLDAKFTPKVADFGFARMIPEGSSHVTTRVKGTLGYLAPEYAMWGKANESCDVFSFGVLLLELVSGRKPIEKLPGGQRRDIVQWAALIAQNAEAAPAKLGKLVADPRLGGRYDAAQLRDMVALALWCSDAKPENRPTMKEVVVEILKIPGGGGQARVTMRSEVKFIQDNGGDEEDNKVHLNSRSKTIRREASSAIDYDKDMKNAIDFIK